MVAIGADLLELRAADHAMLQRGELSNGCIGFHPRDFTGGV
jgi:hypothetical protein